LIWVYWNLRAYRYDKTFQEVVVRVFWDGMEAGKCPESPIDKDNLQ